MMLVAYFSASGRTARLAQTIAQAAQADLYEIRPAQPYTSADLNWHDAHSRSSVEMKDPACRPAIAGICRTFPVMTPSSWASPSGGIRRPGSLKPL